MTYDKCIIKDFKAAWFEKDYSVLNETDFKIVYAEYQDASGLFMTEDFEKQSFIVHLSQRINHVKLFVSLQRDFIHQFEMPFIRDFPNLKEEYGYILKWKNDLDDFENQLQKIEKKEVKHNSFLEGKIKELSNLRSLNKNKEKKEESGDELKKSRLSFIRMINSLGKIGYKIDQEKTTVEELALMIKQQMEEIEDQNNRSQYGR